MTVGILYLKEGNLIHDFFENVTEVQQNRVNFIGGAVEEWDTNKVDVIVTSDLIVNLNKEKNKKYLQDNKGNKYDYGDKLPDGLLDNKSQFFKPTPEIQNQRISDLELMLAELITL